MAAAAPSPLASSVEKTNGAKLNILLIDGGTTVLRNVFDSFHPPANLAADLKTIPNHHILNTLFRRRVLLARQWELLFPPGGATPDSKTFDINLLFVLLTNICGLSPPPSGWVKFPHPSDTSLEANIVRVKIYRNLLLGHKCTTSVDTPTFNALWPEISAVLVALGLDQTEIDRLKAERWGKEDYGHVQHDWADSLEDIKTQLKNVCRYQATAQQKIEEVCQNQLEGHELLQDCKSKLDEVHQTQTKTQETVERVRQTQLADHETLHDSKSELEALHETQTKAQDTLERVRQTQLEDHETLQDSKSKLDEVHQTQTETQDTVKRVRRTQLEHHETLHDSKSKLDEVHQTQTKAQETVKRVRQTQLEHHETLQDSRSKLDEVHQTQTKTQETVKRVRQTQLEDHETLQDSKSKLDEVHQTQSKTQETVERVRHTQLADHETLQDSKSQLAEVRHTQTETQETVERVRQTQLAEHETLQDSKSKLDEVHQTQTKTKETVERVRQTQLRDQLHLPREKKSRKRKRSHLIQASLSRHNHPYETEEEEMPLCSEGDVAATSSVVSEQQDCLCRATTLKVTLLGDEWASSAGGLSTLNRELAIYLAEQPEVEVTLLVPKGACTGDHRAEARTYSITVIEAKERSGYNRHDWLSCPPDDVTMDVVIGHGMKLGRQGQFLKDPRLYNCKWVQMVHTAPEELGMFKSHTDAISEAGRKHELEVDLCKQADLVVPIGPKLAEAYLSYLRSKEDLHIFELTPGLFREFANLKQDPSESSEFKVLLCGRGDAEDFELKGYDIAAKAFADEELNEEPYRLIFVGAPGGKEDEVARELLKCGIAKEQLTVRKFVDSRDKMKDLFCEVDLAIMPSRTEGFGLIALEALSAGLPILVSGNSGFAKALQNLPIEVLCIIVSKKPKDWAKAIKACRARHREQLQHIKKLQESYGKKYSWEKQCEALIAKLRNMVHGID